MEVGVQLLKALTVLLTPLGLALTLILIGLAFSRRSLVLLAAIWLWVWSTPMAAEWLGGTLEYQHVIQPIAALPSADAIVILGGAVDAPVPPWFPEPNLGAAADRIVFGAKLWHAGKAPLVFFTGGTPPPQPSEAAVAAGLLGLMGVPPHAIAQEGESRTTRANAALSAPLLRARGVKRALLVTSVWHMPRALQNFQAEAPDIEWIPAGCDPHTFSDVGLVGSRLLPNTEALDFSRKMFKEWLGIAWAGMGGS